MKTFNKGLLVLSTTLLACPAYGATHQPQVIIKTIKNSSPYAVVISDRYHPGLAPITLVPKQKKEVNFSVEHHRNLVVNGNLLDALASNAQFSIHKMNSNGQIEENKEVFFHLYLAPGGIDDGSSCAAGKPGSIVHKFFLAGNEGGSQVHAWPLKNHNDSVIEVDLDLNTPESAAKASAFQIEADYWLTEK